MDQRSLRQRNLGLDLARLTAIVAVLVCHSDYIFYPQAKAGTGAGMMVPAGIEAGLSLSGAFGVKLFFVLSGLLIGDILLRETRGRLSPSALLRFWRQRLLRTLPAFVVVVGGISLLAGRGSWLYLIFAQGFSSSALAIFLPSWSLAVEEWFYILFPLLLIGLGRKLPPQSAFLSGALVFLSAAALARLAMLLWHPLPWPMLYGWLVPPHLDAPATGLLLAWLKHQRPATWARLAGSPLSLLAGLLLFGASLTLRGVPAAMAFPLLANAACAFGILWLHGLSFGAADRRLRPSAAWGSRLTYCLYLAHWPVFGIWPTLGLAPPVAVSVCVVLGASVLFALLLHVGVEKPFLQLRRRWDAGPIAPAGLARSS